MDQAQNESLWKGYVTEGKVKLNGVRVFFEVEKAVGSISHKIASTVIVFAQPLQQRIVTVIVRFGYIGNLNHIKW
jgi:hypothetical protein